MRLVHIKKPRVHHHFRFNQILPFFMTVHIKNVDWLSPFLVEIYEPLVILMQKMNQIRLGVFVSKTLPQDVALLVFELMLENFL
ncbi:hypothetical protein DZB84_14740 [Bacillus sp. HNG]|nr:hypothetical protein DZB84_14740 [Bacillus sp. HNG]